MLKYHVGTNGYLFLSNDSNDVWRQVSGRWIAPLDDFVDRWTERHTARYLLCRNHGIDYFHLIVPNKETCLISLANYEYGGTKVEKYSGPILNILSETFAGKRTIYFNPSQISEPENFYKTDSHWNHAGAIKYLSAAFNFFGYSRYASILQGLIEGWVPYSIQGDLGLHAGLGPEDSLKASTPSNATCHFQTKVANEGYVRHYTNPAAQIRKKILVMHDSTIHRLYDVISEMYNEVIFIHCPDFDLSFVREFGAEQVYFFQKERFTVRLSSNEASYIDFIHDREMFKGVKPAFADYIRPLLRLQ